MCVACHSLYGYISIMMIEMWLFVENCVRAFVSHFASLTYQTKRTKSTTSSSSSSSSSQRWQSRSRKQRVRFSIYTKRVPDVCLRDLRKYFWPCIFTIIYTYNVCHILDYIYTQIIYTMDCFWFCQSKIFGLVHGANLN